MCFFLLQVEKIKYPPIPSRDITYAVQATSPDEDVVSCIYLGFNPQTHCAVHVHVYRCDSPETADLFVEHLNQLTDITEHKQRIMKIEQDLVGKGQVSPRPSLYVGEAGSDAGSTLLGTEFDSRLGRADERPRSGEGMYGAHGDVVRPVHQERYQPDHVSREGPYSTAPSEHFDNSLDHDPYRHSGRRLGGNPYDMTPIDADRNTNNPLYHDAPAPGEMEPEVVGIYDNVAAELKAKLLGQSQAQSKPILYPPKDYDTIHRTAGNLKYAEEIRRAHTPEPRATEDRHSKDSALPEGFFFGDRRSHGSSRESRGSDPGAKRGSQEYEDPELQPVTPRWKMTGQTYIPPNSPRSHSPVNVNGRALSPSRYGSGGERSRSPMQIRPPMMDRPMSPPPELKENTYFPKGGASPLPNYLPGERRSGGDRRSGHFDPPRSSPQINRRYGAPAREGSVHGSEGSGGGGGGAGGSGGKKYTASSLGLTHGAPVSHSGRSDEGYRSLDRDSDPRQLVTSAYFYDESNQYGAVQTYGDFGSSERPSRRQAPSHVTSMPSLAQPPRGRALSPSRYGNRPPDGFNAYNQQNNIRI